jgi:hypothetical protein
MIVSFECVVDAGTVRNRLGTTVEGSDEAGLKFA